MTVVGRSISAGMLVPVTVYIFAATLPIPCVVSVLPVPGRAGKLRSLTDGAGGREEGRAGEKLFVCGQGRSRGRG